MGTAWDHFVDSGRAVAGPVLDAYDHALGGLGYSRTEADPEAGKPTVETFPAAPPSAGDGRTETPAAPPAPPPHTGPTEAPPRVPDRTETPDQSDELNVPQVYETRFPINRELGGGQSLHPSTEKKLNKIADDRTRQAIRDGFFSYGRHTHGGDVDNVEAAGDRGDARQRMNQIIRDMGGDPTEVTKVETEDGRNILVWENAEGSDKITLYEGSRNYPEAPTLEYRRRASPGQKQFIFKKRFFDR